MVFIEVNTVLMVTAVQSKNNADQEDTIAVKISYRLASFSVDEYILLVPQMGETKQSLIEL